MAAKICMLPEVCSHAKLLPTTLPTDSPIWPGIETDGDGAFGSVPHFCSTANTPDTTRPGPKSVRVDLKRKIITIIIMKGVIHASIRLAIAAKLNTLYTHTYYIY